MLFSTWFSTLGVPTLVAGSVGGGIKLYLRHFSSNANALSFLELVSDDVIAPRTFLDVIKTRNLTPIDDKTTNAQLQTVLLHRLDSRVNTFEFKDEELFKGSKKVKVEQGDKVTGTFTAEPGRTENFEIHVWKQPTAHTAYKNSCKEALANNYEAEKDEQELEKLIRWCTVISNNEELLTRSGFETLNTDTSIDKDNEDWKKIISGGWFTKSTANETYKHWEKQGFLDNGELKKLLGENLDKEIKTTDQVTKEHIDLFKGKCEAVLKKEPSIQSFPISTLFREGINSTKKPSYVVDSFYEATFFCVKPMKAEDYVTNVLKAQVRKVEDRAKGTGNRICSIEGNQTYEWYTYQPAEGKGFWCGVRELYAGQVRDK
ncbi:hypothetical protein MHSWG343_08920 [Candidatus Mycoplasma haematohominis]|uniref:Uncharacterized protein n=1 Tax=Candidatus Mycoplasma haematohominis TaxID=1494318 RepID=A0A478FUT7_9MOLU|nr:hypothetical protein MHSWG343_08920 [Candidatus Mycoplasma haemohominis]